MSDEAKTIDLKHADSPFLTLKRFNDVVIAANLIIFCILASFTAVAIAHNPETPTEDQKATTREQAAISCISERIDEAARSRAPQGNLVDCASARQR